MLSLFCGAGGLDLGFEQAGHAVGLAADRNPDSIASYRRNRSGEARACVEDVRSLTLRRLDELWGGVCRPTGLIGGPPCQSFSQANQVRSDDDPRHELPLIYADLLTALNARHPLPFFVMENVPGLNEVRHRHRLDEIILRLEHAGFSVSSAILNSVDHETPQKRRRLFLVGLNRELFPACRWKPPLPKTLAGGALTVASAIGRLPEPVLWEPGMDPDAIPHHPNHWAMRPKSRRFSTPGMLVPGSASHRSFKTLRWDRPSLTVAYGNREVHVHPDCRRRLSVYEALLLQGFPPDYVLVGSLSSQILQVSAAVPPPLARAVATSIGASMMGDQADSTETGVFRSPQGELPLYIPEAA
ncbi:DNA cytosine methyltransferase [Methylobacterium sp. J-043]|nr:DNA cytosine methyltransferase [Methylobacterium sp. J-043]